MTAMFIGGHLAAWGIRKVSKATQVQSYAVAVPFMTFVGAWSITYDGSPSFWKNWLLYVIGAAIALPLMIATERRKSKTSAQG
jgi:hypothetical protein